MNLQEVKVFINNCNLDELKTIGQVIKERRLREDNRIKSNLHIGDRVTSNDYKWIYGICTVIKINPKTIIVRSDAFTEIRVTPRLLHKVQNL